MGYSPQIETAQNLESLDSKPFSLSDWSKREILRKYFPKSYTPQQMEAVIMKLLEQWMKKRSREQER